MKPFVRKYAWLAAILALCLICVGMGVAVRMSYTDIGADPGLAKAVYQYSSTTPATLHQTAQELMDQAELVASVKVCGEREYKDRTFLTQVEIQEVYKGDPQKTGQTIKIYEPVQLQYATKNGFFDEDLNRYVSSLFPGISPEDPFLVATPLVEATNYHCPMEQGREYLVFLKAKPYWQDSEKYGQTQEYNYVESVYALSLLSEEGNYTETAPSYLTLEEAGAYPVLLREQSDLEVYMENQQRLQESILAKG